MLFTLRSGTLVIAAKLELLLQVTQPSEGSSTSLPYCLPSHTHGKHTADRE